MGYFDDALGDSGHHACCSSCADAALGDILCTPSEAQAGEDAMKRLRSVFASLGSPAKWRPYVDALEARWKEYDDRLFKSVAWCDAKQIGIEATALLQRMSADPGNGTAPIALPPAADPLLTPGPTTQLPSATTLGTVAAVAIGGALALKVLGSR